MSIHVLMFVHRAPPLYGGAGKQALSLATELVSQGVAVTLLTAKLQKDLPSKEIVKGVTVRRLPLIGWVRIRPIVFAILGALYLLLNRRQIDVIHVHGALLSSAPILFLSRQLNKPTVLKIIGMETDDPLTISRRRNGRMIMAELEAASRIVSISSEITESCKQAGLSEDSILQIPNGVDTSLYKPVNLDQRLGLRATAKIPSDCRVAIYVGVVKPLKGSDTLLKAWESVNQRHQNAWLLFIGPYDYFDRYTHRSFLDQIDELLAVDPEEINAHFLDQKDEVIAYYQLADLFVLPSQSEGMSNSLLEAMACGLPVIASQVSGSDEILIDDENGLLVTPGNESILADAITYLLENPNIAQDLGQRARETILNSYSLTAVAAKYVGQYQEIISGKERQFMKENQHKAL